MSRRPALGMAAIAIAAIAPLAIEARACSCVGTPELAEEFGQTRFVFAGVAESVWVERPQRYQPSRVRSVDMPVFPKRLVRFRVERSWKGVPSDTTVILQTPDDEAACGVEFWRGRRYLVFAWQSPDGLSTGLCSRTTAFPGAAKDSLGLEKLGP